MNTFLMQSIEHALYENETDLEALKELFTILKREYSTDYIDEAYNEVIRNELYGLKEK